SGLCRRQASRKLCANPFWRLSFVEDVNTDGRTNKPLDGIKRTRWISRAYGCSLMKEEKMADVLETEIKEAVGTLRTKFPQPHAKNQLAVHETADLIEAGQRYLIAAKDVLERTLNQLTELKANYAREVGEIERRMKAKLDG